ncbi:MAG TPA: ABC transporter transmembrane domain-containing protein [Longimicrobiaceae bacterium]|nr:ABC transporter transmembrane domain-containing protein [Longimicrobiaceae bacterium]
MRLRRSPKDFFDAELRWALGAVVPYVSRLALVLLLSLLGTFVALGLPYLSNILVDDALVGRSMPDLFRVVALWLLVTLLNFFLNLGSGLRYTAVSAAVLFDMRLALYRHLQALSPGSITPARLIATRP